MCDKQKSLVSIIVPVYGVEKYIKRCVDSILCQTYYNIEIILVDDGSPDKCGEICDEYNKLDMRVRVIHKENGGLSDARNVAISLARGEYISFIDSDDWISPYYIQHLLDAVSISNADLGISWFESIFEGRILEVQVEKKIKNYNCLSKEECLKKLLYQNGIEISAWGKLYKRELFIGLSYPKGKLYEDIPVTYEIIKRSKKIAVISNIDYYYFQRKSSIQNMKFNIHKLDGIKNCYNMMNSINLDFPDLVDAAKCRYFSTVCNLIFQIKDNEYELERVRLWNEIVKYRKNVLFNSEARKKARIAALISYAGYDIMNWIYGKIGQRG